MPISTPPSSLAAGQSEAGITKRTVLRSRLARWLPYSAVVLALAGCVADQPRNPAPAPVALSEPVQIWESPAGEFPAICMLLDADGSMRFRGGFAFYNPSKWQSGATPQQLVISLGGDAEFPLLATAQELRKNPSSLIRADAQRREMEFRINGNDKPPIAFGGFYFYRKPTCSAV